MDKKIRSIIVIAFTTLSWAIIAQQGQMDYFERGNKAYENRNYKKALSLYKKIISPSAHVWYNMGNAYYMQNEPMLAIICWKRALNSAPYLIASIKNNMVSAFGSLGKNIPPLSNTFLFRLSHALPLGVMQIMFLFSWLILWLIFTLKIWGRWQRFSLSGCVLIFLLILGFLMWHFYQCHRFTFGIVTKKNVPVYIGPDEYYDVIGSLDQSDCVNVLEQRPGWLKINFKNRAGWIQVQYTHTDDQRINY